MNIFGIGSSNEEANNKRQVYWIPVRDDDTATIGKEVTEKWLENRESYIIHGKSPDKLLETITLYISLLADISQLDLGGGNRKVRWDNLGIRTTQGKRQMVSYLHFVYPSTDIRVHLPDFGYEPRNGTKVFPMSQADMGKGIDQMIAGIKHHGMQQAPIGLTFWEETKEEYEDLMGIKDKKKRDRKPLITRKNELKLEIQRYLRGLKKYLEIVHDHSSEELESELIKWGYQKYFK